MARQPVSFHTEVRGRRALTGALDEAAEDLADWHQAHRRVSDDLLRTASRFVPVRTGELRGSARTSPSRTRAEVEWTATHALPVEFGTRYMAAQPFARRAIDMLPAVPDAYADAMNDIVRDIARAADGRGR